MLRPLLWKEWHEHRWKMLGILGAYLVLAIVGRFLGDPRQLGFGPDSIQICLLGLACLVPGFIAMGTLTEERTHRTIDSLQAFPIRMSVAFAIKWCFGLATVLLPMLAVEVLCWERLFDPRDHAAGMDLPALCIVSTILAGGIYAWTVALAIHKRNDVQAAIVAMAVLLVGGAITFILTTDPQPQPGEIAAQIQWAWAGVAPTGALLLSEAEHGRQLLGLLPFNAIVLALLLLWSARRYGAHRTPQHAAGRLSSDSTNLSPIAYRWPVLWKTTREIGWLCWCYLNTACLFIFAVGLLRLMNGSQLLQDDLVIHTRLGYVMLSNSALAVYGISNVLLTVVIGTEIGMGDSEGMMDQFCFSRPLDMRLYFWKRFFIGLFASAACALLPLIFVLFLCSMLLAVFVGWGTPDFVGETIRQAGSLMRVAPLICITYASAVFFSTLLRWRVPAMIFAACVPVAQIFLPMIWFEESTRIIVRYILDDPACFLIFCLAELLLILLAGFLAQLCYTGQWKDRLFELLGGTPAIRPRRDTPARSLA